MNLQAIKDNALSWALVTIIGWGNIQLQKVVDTGNELAKQLTKQAALVDNHEYRLNQHRDLIRENAAKNNEQDVAINVLKTLNEKMHN